MPKKSFLTTNLIAHRGVHYQYLENTIPAFREAVKLGLAIELDVRLTKDNQVVVYHDANLKRLFDLNREVDDMTLTELKKYTYIPTLTEVLNLVNNQVPLFIELKTITKKKTLEKALVQVLNNYQGEVAIQSFSPLSLLWFKLNSKDYPRGYLINTLIPTNFMSKILLYPKLLKHIIKPDYIGANLKALDTSYIKKIRKKYLIIGYTINTKAEYQHYKALSDNLICNINS